LGSGAPGKWVVPGAASSYVQFPDLSDYNTLGGLTVVAIAKPNATITQMSIVSKDAAGGGTATPLGFLLENGALSLNRANGGFRVWNSVATVPSLVVSAVAVTQGSNIGTAPKFYINGVLDTGSPVNKFGGSGTGAPTTTTATLKIGMNTANANQFFGEIYDVVILNRECTAAEVEDLSLNMRAVWEPEPLYWFFPGAVGGTTYNQSIDGSITIAGALTKQTNKAVAGSSTPSGALTRLISKSFGGSITYAGNIVKLTQRALSSSITGTGNLATMILFTASLDGSITPSGAIAKMTIKALAGATTLAGAISKMTAKGLGGELTMTGALAKLTARALSGSVTVSGAVTTSYQVLKSLAGSITPTGALGAVYIAFVAGVLKLLSLMGVGQ
jgi:hypothetical protein